MHTGFVCHPACSVLNANAVFLGIFCRMSLGIPDRNMPSGDVSSESDNAKTLSMRF